MRCHRSMRRSARGQALIFGLLFAGVAAIVVLLLFNSALLTTTKSQLQNAADAGAYSASVLQARDANFSAYTNRAMIANQVAVAQLVSLESYFEDARQTHRRVRSGGIPNTWRTIFPSSAPAWDAARRLPLDAEARAVQNLVPPAVKALNLLIDALDLAQEAHHDGTMVDMMLVADDVVKKNDPLAKVTTSTFMVGSAAYRVVTEWGKKDSKRFSANDTSSEADRFADLVVNRDSTDGFIRNRLSAPTALWASNVKFCFLAVRTSTAFGFAHAGGTILSANKKRWLALDATMGAGFWSCTWVYPCPVGVCSRTIGTPLPDMSTTQAPYVGGHGGAVTGAGGRYGSLTGYKNNPWDAKLYGLAITSPAAVPALYRYGVTGPGTSIDTNGGIQDHYRDVAAPAASAPKNQSPEENGGRFPVTVEVERTAATIRTTETLMPSSKQLELASEMKGNTLRAIASAHAYFYRPRTDSLALFTRNGWRRGDGRTEFQNRFSPYWQSQLAPTTAAEELAAATAQ